jgi:hypothetical protein
MMMRSISAILLTVALTTSSLAAQQPADEARSWRTLAATLEPAAMVSIRLKDGKHIVGTILDRSDDSLVLKPRTRVPVAARAIAFTDIESIERKKTAMSPGAKVLLGVGVGIGALMFGVLLAFAAYGD